MNSKIFSLEVHYGGSLKNIPHMAYEGGNVVKFEKVDADLMSFFEIEDIIGQCGCNKSSYCYYRIPMVEGDKGLKLLRGDGDVAEMFALHQNYLLIKLFVVEEAIPEHEVTIFEVDCEDVIMEMLNDVPYEPMHNEVFTKATIERQYEIENEEVDSIVETIYGQSDELQSLNNSSNEDDAYSTPHTNFSREKDLGVLTLGMKFGSVVEFREALKYAALKGKFDLKYVKNDGKRVTAECKANCGWRIHASNNLEEGRFQIKTFESVHNCAGVSSNTQATSSLIAQAYIDQLRVDPTWKTDAFRDAIARDLRTDVSEHKIYRARKKAMEIVEGEYGGQYSKLREYCELMIATNPGTVANISTLPTSEDSLPVFKRLFVCFDAMRRGFKEGCRPFIGLDGCFLKHGFGGQLISAIGVYGNDGIFPIAYAIVEAENKDSWTWFVKELMDVIGPHNSLTFMSDRQKGLVETFKDVLYGADHRFCVRHLYENFKLTFKGMKLKQALWNTGIPCKHVIAAIFTMRGVVEEYVDPIYHRETFIRAYSPVMHPIPIRNLRLSKNTGLRAILPPEYKQPPGRPKKVRRRGQDERKHSGNRVGRFKPHLRCSKCHELGHNTRTCKAKTSVTKETPSSSSSRGGRPPAVRIERETPPSRGGRTARGGRTG